MIRLCLILIAACLSLGVAAQTQMRVPVVVAHSGQDDVGQRVAYELREGIRASQSMRLAADAEVDARITVHLVSLDDNRQNPGHASSLAAVYAFDANELPHLGYLLTVFVQNCGIQRTQDCARNLLAYLDREIESLRNKHPGNYSRLK